MLEQYPYTKDWPRPGRQDDGTYVSWRTQRSGCRPLSYQRHANLAELLLHAQGGNKQRLLTRIWLAQGHDPSDNDGLQAFLLEHAGSKWTFKRIHATYDHHLTEQQ